MRTENIKVGDVYKNYPALCEALGIEAKRGDSKKKQLREIEEVLKYKRIGNSFVIEEVYEKRHVSIHTSTKSNKSKRKKRKRPLYYHFSNYVQPLLLHYLYYSTEEKVMNVSMLTLFKTLGLLGQSYDFYENAKDFRLENTDISISEIRLLKNRAYKKCYSIIMYSLTRLKNQNLIRYEIIDKLTVDGNERFATTEESCIITQERQKLFRELKCKDISAVYIKGLMKKYDIELKTRLEEKYNWTKVRKLVHIELVDDVTIEDMETSECREILNKNLIDYLMKSVSYTDKETTSLIIDKFIKL